MENDDYPFNTPVLTATFTRDVPRLINAAEKLMLEQGVNLIQVDLSGEHLIDDLIRAGFMPNYIADNTAGIYQEDTWILIDHYIEKFSPEAIKFWHEERGRIEPAIGKSSHQWYLYGNIQGWRELAIRTSIALPLLMYAPDQVYRSKRPRTEMLMFRQATSLAYNRIQDDSSYSRLVIGDSFQSKGLPVTRYAAGMSKGLYYDDAVDTKFCGTFYYFEPESTTYLTFNTAAVYKNKHEAIKALIGGGNHADFTDRIVDKYYNYPEEFPYSDLMLTPTEYMEVVHGRDLAEFDEPYWLKIEQRKHYVGRHLHLYGVEDEYDQDLCKAGRDAGIDVIILTQMVGAFKLVTEILDTRERLDSFRSLAFPL
jgi:hypothetical protein